MKDFTKDFIEAFIARHKATRRNGTAHFGRTFYTIHKNAGLSKKELAWRDKSL